MNGNANRSAHARAIERIDVYNAKTGSGVEAVQLIKFCGATSRVIRIQTKNSTSVARIHGAHEFDVPTDSLSNHRVMRVAP